MARTTAVNTRKVSCDKAAATNHKTEEDKEQSKELNSDDDELGLW